MFFLARITREGNATLADFPDCPGCQTFARAPESIDRAAAEALHGWLESMLDANDTIPTPRVRVTARRGQQVRAIPVEAGLAARIALRWARDEARLSQSEVARRMGVTPQAISKVERNAGSATVATLARYAESLGAMLDVRIVRPANGVAPD